MAMTIAADSIRNWSFMNVNEWQAVGSGKLRAPGQEFPSR
jgi:hypothetical protein